MVSYHPGLVHFSIPIKNNDVSHLRENETEVEDVNHSHRSAPVNFPTDYPVNQPQTRPDRKKMQLSDFADVAGLFKEENALFTRHPSSSALVNKKCRLQMPLMDINPSITETSLSFVRIQAQESGDLTQSYDPMYPKISVIRL